MPQSGVLCYRNRKQTKTTFSKISSGKRKDNKQVRQNPVVDDIDDSG